MLLLFPIFYVLHISSVVLTKKVLFKVLTQTSKFGNVIENSPERKEKRIIKLIKENQDSKERIEKWKFQ
jgi:hypothetical protein